ncbi:MAG: TonB-dependent receptor, partial [Bacteroidota bacterium]
MMRNLLLLICLLIISFGLSAQTSLQGKVIDSESGEPLIYASILLLKDGNSVGGTTTDLDGNFSINPIDPGTYNIEFSYTGYTSQRQEDVVILAGKVTILEIKLIEGVLAVEGGVEIVGYRVPLVEQDNTTQGATITSEQIRNLPTRNINALAATTAGLASADEGDDIGVRGSRANSTDYYVDGIRVSGALIPESEIDQLQVITGGVEARYGDVTGGIISITTKGPSSKWSGGLEMETSEFFDAYDNRLVGFNFSGPLLKNRDKSKSIVGIRVAGRYTYQLDDDPSAVDVFRVTDATLAELEGNPLILRTNNNGTVSSFVAADFTDFDDVNALAARPFEEFTRYDLTTKLDARLSDAIDITFSGAYSWRENFFTPSGNIINGGGSTSGGTWRTFNAHNNPADLDETLRGNFRFRHRLGGAPTADDDSRASVIQNASYTLQFSYENNLNDLSDTRHGQNYFDYGYVGNFDIEWIPTFTFDVLTQSLTHTDYRQILRGYEPGTVNPVLANYNNILGDAITGGEGINSGIPDYLIFFPGGASATPGISLDQFFSRNGFTSSQFTSTWDLHTNVGTVYNNVRNRDNDLYTFNANSSFELVPGGKSSKGRHNIEFGVLYEQRTNRTYQVFPRNLWQVARQQANAHIQGIAENADSIGSVEIPNFGNVALLDLAIDEGSDNSFYRKVREATGVPLDAYINVDGLSPDQLSLDM